VCEERLKSGGWRGCCGSIVRLHRPYHSALPTVLYRFAVWPPRVHGRYQACCTDRALFPVSHSACDVLSGYTGYQKTIAELKPGVVAVHDGTNVKEYFVSGGFAIIQGGSADVTCVEAVKVENIDAALIGPGTFNGCSCFGCLEERRRGGLSSQAEHITGSVCMLAHSALFAETV
jgi:hypothetical protein